MKKHSKAVLLTIGAAILLIYISSLHSQVSEAAKQNRAFKDEINTLSEIESLEAAKTNKLFLTAFFNYDNLAARNEEIKPLMSSEGYQSIQLGEGKEEANISVSATNIKSYERFTDKKTASFLTELDLTISYDKTSDKETNYIKTELVYIEGKGWKVDKISILGILGAAIQD